MIVRGCTILLKNESASLSDTLVLYKGDQNIEYTFTLKDNAYKFSNSTDGNIVTQLEASYSQILLYKSPSIRVTFPVQATNDGKVILKIEKELIDESNEVGDYDLQIRLYDSNKEAILTLPPLLKAIHVKSPLFDSVSADSALADVTTIDETGSKEVIFGEDGNYLKTTWTPGMKITSEKLNKIEEALYKNTSQIKEIGEAGEGHTHTNKSTLDKITDEKILGWDSKAEGGHNHDTVYAKKSEIPIVDVTKQYVDTELGKKSPIHEHPYLSKDTVIPSRLSQLENDSNFITTIPSEYITENELINKGYITNEQIKNKVDKEEGKGLSTNDFTTAEKEKLKGLNNYTLPAASATVLGGVKVGAGLSIANGVLSATGGGTADSVDWGNIQNKPSVFTPDTHVHSYNDLTNKPTIPTVDVTKKYVDDELLKKSPIHEHPYLSNKTVIPTKTSELENDSNFITSIPNEYITEVELEGKGYLTSHQDISHKADKAETYTKTQTDSKIAEEIAKAQLGQGEVDLSAYATKEELKAKADKVHTHEQYLTSHQDISGKVDKEEGKGLSKNDLTDILKSNYDNAYTHSQSSHAPTNAQKNSDITKAEIEAKLTGQITSHTHAVEVPKDTLITTNIVGTSLKLTTDKYQTTKMVNGTEIVLPSVTSFTEIHLFFSTTTDMTLVLPNCKWQSQPTINAKKSYELIFTYTTEWLGGCVVYE